jgi:hypothetical protein
MPSFEPPSLTGVWDGRYSYPRRLSPVPFTAVMLETGHTITGTIHEQPPDGPSAGRTRNAVFEGERRMWSVDFTKTYDPPGPGFNRPVLYRGQLSSDFNEIEGTWTVLGGWSGRFLMIRSPRPDAQAEVERRVTEPTS